MELKKLVFRTKLVIAILTVPTAFVVNLIVVSIFYSVATTALSPWNYVGIALLGLTSFAACTLATGMTLKFKFAKRRVLRYAFGSLIGIIWDLVTTVILLKPAIDYTLAGIIPLRYKLDLVIPFPVYFLIVLAMVTTAFQSNNRLIDWFVKKVRTAS